MMDLEILEKIVDEGSLKKNKHSHNEIMVLEFSINGVVMRAQYNTDEPPFKIYAFYISSLPDLLKILPPYRIGKINSEKNKGEQE